MLSVEQNNKIDTDDPSLNTEQPQGYSSLLRPVKEKNRLQSSQFKFSFQRGLLLREKLLEPCSFTDKKNASYV